jgi:hypothetical protein
MEEDFIRLHTIFEVPRDITRELALLSKRIIRHRKVFFTLDESASYPLKMHPHVTLYAPEYPRHNMNEVIENVRQYAFFSVASDRGSSGEIHSRT